MSEFFRKNWWAWCLILVIVIVILAILRIMGGSTWAEWWGLQLFNLGVFWGQRPLHYETVGPLISFGSMIALVIILIIIIYFLRRTFFKKG
ncbi:MAG: hypothetical protein ACFE89_01155 [Candidatus Hodarchaeota archaeon]